MSQVTIPAAELATKQARAEIHAITKLWTAYHRLLFKDREGAIAVLDEVDAMVYDTDTDDPKWVSFLLAGGGPEVRLRVQRIGKAPGPALLEARHWGTDWIRLPLGRNQKAAAHWFACRQHPFSRSL